MRQLILEKNGTVHKHKWQLQYKVLWIYAYCAECRMRITYPSYRLWPCFLVALLGMKYCGIWMIENDLLVSWHALILFWLSPLLIYAICLWIAYIVIRKTCTEEKLHLIMED